MYTVHHPVRGDCEYETVLDALHDFRVVSVRGNKDGTFTVCEECDDYYSITLTKEQLIALADELRSLANGA